jgi:hypothetical protein
VFLSRVKILPFEVIDQNDLTEIKTDQVPVDGDPLEIDSEIYYVCETKCMKNNGFQKIGVIPMVVKNPSVVQNI